MEQTLITKMTRFVELSKKFTKSEIDVFGKKETATGVSWIISEESSYIKNTGDCSGTIKNRTRAEKIKSEAEIEAQLSDDYDEYLQLQSDLTEYFNALNKLN